MAGVGFVRATSGMALSRDQALVELAKATRDLLLEVAATYRATITDRTPWLDPARPGELRLIIGPRTYRWRQQDAAQGYTWTDDGDAITITGHGAPEAL
mgnify:CR=1 FL=1